MGFDEEQFIVLSEGTVSIERLANGKVRLKTTDNDELRRNNGFTISLFRLKELFFMTLNTSISFENVQSLIDLYPILILPIFWTKSNKKNEI